MVFDLGVVEALLHRGPDSLAIRSVGDIGLEEIKVTADREDRVLTIGKHVPARGAMGESLDIQADLYDHLEKVVDRFEDVSNKINALVTDHL